MSHPLHAIALLLLLALQSIGVSQETANGEGAYARRLAALLEQEMSAEIAGRLQELVQPAYFSRDHSTAESAARVSLEFWLDTLGEDHSKTLQAKRMLALVLKEGIDLEEALALEEQVFEIYEETLDEADEARLTHTQNMAVTLNRMGRNERARELMEVAIATIEDDPSRWNQTGGLLHDFTVLLRETGAYEEMQVIAEQFVILLEENLPAGHPDLIEALDLLATSYDLAGDMEGARRIREEIVMVLEESLPEDHLRTLEARQDLALLMLQMGEVAPARAMMERIYEVRSELLPENHESLQFTRGNLAHCLKTQGDLEGARALEEKALAAYEANPPDNFIFVERFRVGLALTLFDLGDTYRAEKLLEHAVEIYVRELPPNDPDRLGAMMNLGFCKRAAGDPEGSRRIFEDVLAIELQQLPGGHPSIQKTRSNLATTLVELAEYDRAREIQETVVANLERIFPEDHPDLLQARIGLSTILRNMDDLPTARLMLEQVLETQLENLPEDHLSVQLTRLNLAGMLSDQDEPEKALPLAQQVVEVYEERLPEGHPNLLLARQGLANVAYSLGNPAKALELQEQALTELRRTLPDDNSHVLKLRSDIALSYRMMGQLERSHELIEQVLAIREATLEPDHGDLLWAQHNAIISNVEIGNLDRTRALLAAFADSLLQRLGAAHLVSRREASEVARQIGFHLNPILSYDTAARLPHAVGFTVIEATRALRSAPTADWGAAAGNPELLELLDEARRWRAQVRTASDNGDAEGIRLATRRRDEVERQLRERIPGSGADGITPATLAPALRPGTAAVGYWQYFRDDPDQIDLLGTQQTEVMIAHVLRSDGRLLRVPLGPVEVIEESVRTWRSAIGHPVAAAGPAPGPTAGPIRSDPDSRGALVLTEEEVMAEEPVRDADSSGIALRSLILDPVLEAAGDVEALHVCVDGVLSLVPLDALPLDAGCVGDRVSIHDEVSFARLARDDAGEGAEPSLLSFGGIDYGSAQASAVPTYAQLPGTEQEVRQLTALYREVHDDDATVRSGARATRSAFVELAGRSSFLHLATHGYFAAGRQASSSDRSASPGLAFRSSTNRIVTEIAPMALCGLVLSGANEDPAEGIITAEEIAGLDLSRCQLAVLSACETNVGIQNGQRGIQSLQAALHAAGVRTSITSLWKVDDSATRELMLDFYRRIWIDGLPKSDALWLAKKRLREAGAPVGIWGAWVLAGNPE